MNCSIDLNKNGVHVHRQEDQREGERDASADPRAGQRRQDHDHQEVQRLRHRKDLTDPRLQYQDSRLRRLQTQCLGHRWAEDYQVVLA
jgi:hypothetical protein